MQQQAIITGPEIRAARALLGWTSQELAERARISRDGLRNAETSPGIPQTLTKTVIAIRSALEAGGAVFLVLDDPDIHCIVALRKS
jgi:hypothetical protein